MNKTLADAVFEAEKFSTKKEKFGALSGLSGDSLNLLYECFNPYRVFGIRKYSEPSSYASSDASNQVFLKLLDDLAERRVTGNRAKDLVTLTLSMYTERTAKVLKRVLNKDLDCGANRNTFEKLYTLNIPTFYQMLCQKIEQRKGDDGVMMYPFYKWNFPLLGEVKYDGYRMIAFVKNGEVNYLSRGGKPADQWIGLFEADLIAMENHVGEPIVVDGEALADSFQATAKAKGKDGDKSGMKFFAFDWMTMKEWDNQKCYNMQINRTNSLDKMIKELKLIRIVKSKSKVLNNMKEALEFYNEVIELGLPGQDEGLIIKELDGFYEWVPEDKRSMTWAKWKPVIDVDVTIVGAYEGVKGTKNEGRLGGFLVEGKDENGNKIKSRCGGFKVNSAKFKVWIAAFCKKNKIDLAAIYASGVSKDEFFRTYAWKNQNKFIGQVCMIETQELSLAQDSDAYALRFPFFIMLRDDK